MQQMSRLESKSTSTAAIGRAGPWSRTPYLFPVPAHYAPKLKQDTGRGCQGSQHAAASLISMATIRPAPKLFPFPSNTGACSCSRRVRYVACPVPAAAAAVVAELMLAAGGVALMAVLPAAIPPGSSFAGRPMWWSPPASSHSAVILLEFSFGCSQPATSN